MMDSFSSVRTREAATPAFPGDVRYRTEEGTLLYPLPEEKSEACRGWINPRPQRETVANPGPECSADPGSQACAPTGLPSGHTGKYWGNGLIRPFPRLQLRSLSY